jgi:pseudaminic acid synthase
MVMIMKKLNAKTFIISELSANHNNDKDIALKTIQAIAESGADAIKLQTYTADTITINCDNEYFKINKGTIWDGTTLYELYKNAYTPWEWHKELFDYAKSLGLICFSSPFDKTAVDFLETLDNPIYKIASFEITDIPLIEYVGSKKKPVLLSTGIATLADIEEAITVLRKNQCEDITILKCTSSYPALIKDANLKTMQNLKETFGVKIGLSDHTLGSDVAIAAVAMGAKVIEKHFILDRKLGGPDAVFSMEPDEFKNMVKSIRNVEDAIGVVDYSLNDDKKKNREFSRSLFVVKDIKKGEQLTDKNIRSIRPGFGIHPRYLKDIIGKKARLELKKGVPVSWDIIE